MRLAPKSVAAGFSVLVSTGLVNLLGRHVRGRTDEMQARLPAVAVQQAYIKATNSRSGAG